LGLFTNDASGVFQRSVITGAREVATRAGLRFEVTEVPTPPERASQVLESLGSLAGSLVIANVLGDAVLNEIARSGHPVTLVSHRANGLGVPSVMHDNRQGMRQLVEHLVEVGRSRIVYVGGNRSQLDGRERERFFREELMRHSLHVPPERFLEGDFRPGVAAASMRAYLDATRDLDAIGFDAVVAADYLMAIDVLAVLRAAGLRVPADVSVVAFGDGPEAAAAELTVVGADVVELGRRSARQLIAQVQGERFLGYTLIRTRLMQWGK
jgi:DNA-binding LacI/PurR family transcriptional regulator